MPTPETLLTYRRKSLRLTAWLLGVWFLVTFVVTFNARSLSFSFFGWPVSFYMAAQGSVIVYVLIIWFYARRMNRLDDAYVDADRH